MGELSGYTTTTFSPTQKFLIFDVASGTTKLILGSDLVNYISPNLGYVRTETTRAAAQNTDYAVGVLIQTAGGTAIGDGGNGMFLVVAGGSGDYSMLNGNDLLLLPFGSLSGSNLDGGLVTVSGTQTAIETEIASINTDVNKRQIQYATLEDLRASSETADTVIVTRAVSGGPVVNMELYKDGTGTASTEPNIFSDLSSNSLCNAAGNRYRLLKTKFISVCNFGVLWDDATDDTTNLQYAVNWANAASATVGSVTLRCPKGGCRITSLSFASMTSGIVFEGEYELSSFFRYTNATGNVFDFTGARFVKFRNFQILPLSGAYKTAGHLFHIDNGDDLDFENLRLNSSWEGFYITDASGSSSGINIKNVRGVDYGTTPWNWFIRIHGACSSIKLDDTILQSSAVITGGNILIEKNGSAEADTIRMFRVDSQKSASGLIPYGVKIEGGDFIHMLECMHEVGGSGGIGIDISGGNDVHVIDNHVTTAENGIVISGGKGHQIVSGRYYYLQKEGIKVTGGSNLSITAPNVLDVSLASAGTYDGISATDPSISNIKILGPMIGTVRGTVVKMNHGVNVAGAGGVVQVTGAQIDPAVINGKSVNYQLAGAGSSTTQLIIADNGNEPATVIPTHARVRTTDATPTTIWSYTLNDNEHLNIVANVICQGSSGIATAGYIRAATVYRDGGGAVIEGSVTAIHSAEVSAGLDCTITVSGNDVRVTVTGVGGSTFDWHANVQINGKASAA